MLIITFNKNNVNEFSGKKRKKIESAPTNAPLMQERIDTPLFRR